MRARAPLAAAEPASTHLAALLVRQSAHRWRVAMVRAKVGNAAPRIAATRGADRPRRACNRHVALVSLARHFVRVVVVACFRGAARRRRQVWGMAAEERPVEARAEPRQFHTLLQCTRGTAGRILRRARDQQREHHRQNHHGRFLKAGQLHSSFRFGLYTSTHFGRGASEWRCVRVAGAGAAG